MKFKLDLRKIWTISLVLYIICSSAFSYGSLRMLNTYALYFFLAVSAVNILHRGKVKLNFAVICIVLYALLSLIGMLYTPTSESVVSNVVYNFITMAVIVLCVVQYINRIEDVKIIMFGYMLAGLALAIYVYAQYGNAFWTLMRESTDNNFGQVDRLGSDLTNVNIIGMYTMTSALIAAYHIIFDRTSKWKTAFCAAIGIFCFLVSMAAASKKSILFLLIACLGIWLYTSLGNQNIKKQLRNILILTLCVIGFFWLITTLPMFSGIASRMDSLFASFEGGGTVSEENRFAFVSTGLSVWMDHILFGAGTAASIHYLGVYCHNNFVEILMNTGFVGFVLFYAAYPVGCYEYLANAKIYKAKNNLSILLFALLVSMSVCGLALVYYYERYYMILLTVIFSTPRVLNEHCKENSPDEGKEK